MGQYMDEKVTGGFGTVDEEANDNGAERTK